jgi:hypothetical protein
MKLLLSLSLPLLAVLAGGCVTEYSPASPDYYPQLYPPYLQDSTVALGQPRKAAADRAIDQFLLICREPQGISGAGMDGLHYY